MVSSEDWAGPRCRYCAGGLADDDIVCRWCGFPTRPDGCRVCGVTPAATVSFRRNTGMIIMFRTEKLPGPYCRDCGVAQFRDSTNYTLLAGWWGVISFFVNWWCLAQNLRSRQRIASLAEPVRSSGAPPPLPTGRPLAQRPGLWLPVGAVVVVILLNVLVEDPATTPFYTVDRPEDLLERCVEIVGEDVGEADCDEPNDGRISGVVDHVDQCPRAATTSFTVEGRIGRVIACVTPTADGPVVAG